ncbi:MAG: hypothetical protein KDJ98_18885 [Rhodobacteraceae bacterium]|nr:hypothetical protein [Paracoccaceae bacterium]
MIWKHGFVAVGLLVAAGPVWADVLGEMTFRIADHSQTRPVTDERAGLDTWWNTGGVSIHMTGQNGGTVLLTFTENGSGPAQGPHLAMIAGDGSAWQDVSGSMTVDLTRADNRPPRFSIAGSFSGRIEPVAGGPSYPISGRFDVLLPRQDFAPTPGPGDVPGH